MCFLCPQEVQGSLKSRAGSEAREYLTGRGLTQEIIDKFQLGYAPAGWDYVSASAKLPASAKVLWQSGLDYSKDNGGYYDRFRNRIMFPIYETGGRVVGFGGRTLGDEQPKYLNSPETPVFKKEKNCLP